MHSVGEGYCQSLASVTRSGDDWRCRMHGNLLLAATDHQRQAAHRMSIMLSQVRAMHKRHINTRNSAHDLSVKLSPCICIHTDSSCPGCWYIAICLQILLCTMTNQIAACSGSPHYDESSQWCPLTSKLNSGKPQLIYCVWAQRKGMLRLKDNQIHM